MGNIYSSVCTNCNRLYNFDVGIGSAYNKESLMNINSDFNLLKLFKEKKRINDLKNILEFENYELKNDYGHKMCICDTCNALYSRFCFNIYNDSNEFSTKYLCHKCKRKLRILSDRDILNDYYICNNCGEKITFYKSGEWN